MVRAIAIVSGEIAVLDGCVTVASIELKGGVAGVVDVTVFQRQVIYAPGTEIKFIHTPQGAGNRAAAPRRVRCTCVGVADRIGRSGDDPGIRGIETVPHA